MNDKYKTFNLERVLAGDKFARKSDLCEPSEWYYFRTDSNQKLCCVIEGRSHWYWDDGRYSESDSASDNDLVMLPKTKKLFVGIEKCKTVGSHDTTRAYNTIGELRAACSKTWYENNCQVVEIEIEDNE